MRLHNNPVREFCLRRTKEVSNSTGLSTLAWISSRKQSVPLCEDQRFIAGLQPAGRQQRESALIPLQRGSIESLQAQARPNSADTHDRRRCREWNSRRQESTEGGQRVAGQGAGHLAARRLMQADGESPNDRQVSDSPEASLLRNRGCASPVGTADCSSALQCRAERCEPCSAEDRTIPALRWSYNILGRRLDRRWSCNICACQSRAPDQPRPESAEPNGVNGDRKRRRGVGVQCSPGRPGVWQTFAETR